MVGRYAWVLNKDNAIISHYKDHVVRINRELENLLNSREILIEDIGDHARIRHGNRIRSLLFVLACQFCNYHREDAYHLSTIFEYIHRASLLHDEVLDNAHVREKEHSASRLLRNNALVLGGNYLYSKASSIAVGSHNMLFLKRVIETTTQMMEGQILDLVHTNDWETDREQYIDIIKSKKAVLVSAACACGAIISGSEKEVQQCLGKFGLNVGIAIQLMDDIFAYVSLEQDIGKLKITLPLIYTLSNLQESERERFTNLSLNSGTSAQDYRDLIALVKSNGMLSQIRYEAQSYIDKAAHCLDTFPDSSAKSDLLELARSLVSRDGAFVS